LTSYRQILIYGSEPYTNIKTQFNFWAKGWHSDNSCLL